MLYYDTRTETFWSQMTGVAVVGPQTGTRLKWMPTEVTTWKDWRARHPETTVLRPLGKYLGGGAYKRTNDYYSRYRRGGRWMFPMAVEVDKRYKPMAAMTIVRVGGKARGYPHAELADGATSDGDLTIRKTGKSVTVWSQDGKQVPAITGYWFAWCAFYKDGVLYERPSK